MPRPTRKEQQEAARRTMLARLDASRPYLESVSVWEIAIELIVQALDICPEPLWPNIVHEAKASLKSDGR